MLEAVSPMEAVSQITVQISAPGSVSESVPLASVHRSVPATTLLASMLESALAWSGLW